MMPREETSSCLDSRPHATETQSVVVTAKGDNDPDYKDRLEKLKKHDSNYDGERSTSSKWRYELEPCSLFQ